MQMVCNILGKKLSDGSFGEINKLSLAGARKQNFKHELNQDVHVIDKYFTNFINKLDKAIITNFGIEKTFKISRNTQL